MNIINMMDITYNTPKRAMLYGSPGSGKTSIAISGKLKKLLVDLESGAGRALANSSTDVWIPQTLAEFINELNDKNTRGYDVIVIDTLGRLVEMLVKKHSGSGGVPNQNTWGAVRRDLSNWWLSLLRLNKHVVLTAHGKHEEGGSYVPEVLGKSPALILRDLDYVGVVKEHKIIFNMPNSWCKNTHSKMADEVTVNSDKGFIEVLLSEEDSEIKAPDKSEFEKEIDNIRDVTQLHNKYKFFIENSRDALWKEPLKTKAERLGAVFNIEVKRFEQARA